MINKKVHQILLLHQTPTQISGTSQQPRDIRRQELQRHGAQQLRPRLVVHGPPRLRSIIRQIRLTMGAGATMAIAMVTTRHSAALHSRAQRLATQRNVRHLHLHSMDFSRAYRTSSRVMLGNLLAQLWVIAAAAAVARGDLEVCSEVTLVH